MADPKRKHEDTSVSFHPRTFREAVNELADSPPQKDTKPADRSPAPKQKRTVRVALLPSIVFERGFVRVHPQELIGLGLVKVQAA